MTEQTKAEPVGEVYRYGKDSHGRQWHGIHWYDPNLDVPTGTKLFIHAPYQTNPWRDAVDHELSTLHMVASDDPRESIRRLIDWHCAVQIDPLVSSAAQELIERGKREAQMEQEPVAWFNGKPVYSAPPRREWRSLSEEEILPLYSMLPSSHAEMLEFARAVEAALRSATHEPRRL